MNNTSLPTPKSGWILCRDPRLCRLLETELAYLGVPAEIYPTLPPSSDEVCLLVADGDTFGADSCLALAAACGCPLLIFGREPVLLPAEKPKAAYLRRPFALTVLEKTVRHLLPASFGSGALSGMADTTDRSPAAPALTVKDGVVTVDGHTVTLTPTEWAIFEYLRARAGQAVTREELSSLLGGGGNIVDVYVCRLRAKIEEPLGRRVIRTVRGVGYEMSE